MFKKVGLVIMLAWVVVAVLMLCGVIDKIIFGKDGFFAVLNAALLMMAMSRDRHENEMKLQVRYQSMFWAFSFIALYTIVNTFLHPHREATAQGAIFMMLLGYNLMFLWIKQALRL